MLEGLAFLVVSFAVTLTFVLVREHRRRRIARRPGYLDLRSRHR